MNINTTILKRIGLKVMASVITELIRVVDKDIRSAKKTN